MKRAFRSFQDQCSRHSRSQTQSSIPARKRRATKRAHWDRIRRPEGVQCEPDGLAQMINQKIADAAKVIRQVGRA